MKQFIILLIAVLPLAAKAQTTCPEDRKVLNLTADLWKSNFSTVIDAFPINGEATINLPRDVYTANFPNSLKGSSICSSFTICYYLTNENQLKTAIEIDDNRFLIYNESEDWIEMDSSYLNPLIANLRGFLNQGDHPFAYVLKYAFNRQNIDRMIYVKDASEITIENVIHSVSPDTERYQLPSQYNERNMSGIEGVLAFDILLKYELDGQENEYHNFARPCPKLCDSVK